MTAFEKRAVRLVVQRIESIPDARFRILGYDDRGSLGYADFPSYRALRVVLQEAIPDFDHSVLPTRKHGFGDTSIVFAGEILLHKSQLERLGLG
jgi:hypothetical protein